MKAIPTVVRASMTIAALLAAASVHAQNWPTRPITWIVPFAAGGPTDALARTIADRVSREVGQSIIIENTPGAGGTIGAGKAARAPADGYTMLVGHMGYMGAAPALYKKLPYDPVKDFAPVFRFPDTPMVLMVRKDHPAKDVRALVDYGKQNPGKLFISNAGMGSTSHLIAAMFASSAGIKVSLVPYKGAGPALIDVIGGQVDGMFDQTNTALPQITEAKVRPLAVTSARRVAQLKDVPTLAETVAPAFEAATWYGIYAPKGTAPAAVEKMQQAYLKVMKDKAFTDRLSAQAIQMLREDQYTASALGKHTEAEVARWKVLAAKANISLD
ncbi:tripartite tricarboxylate transporter substrate-binding protein [Cupriavidus gilardii]|uniref:tripartite tricarboxylate transporter substrate-binding protein n=1 Tax=Cupriavidus gilardii TaxID=82541 RepID=UPI001580F532|nr:tripartite tricarboxylate transporter substrate-binding protein [Cupriavidus gilardii]MCT9071330.1 tripartite tricarboxylate transporter substrate-binding protein [Cupriavidus gilardii]MCT9073175.1 tripartite tricarboxylate transporter substrate-binding protein [Cupriavidus gilardii]QKS60776.1 tripartite tricarboxylate transporter substrate binding protein BugD [Cupriavidus gilardii]